MKNGLELGEQFTLRGSSGRPVQLRVAGFFQPPRIAELLGGIVISQQSLAKAFPRAQTSSR